MLKKLNSDPPESVVIDLAKKYKMTIIDSMEDFGFHFLIEEGKPEQTWIDVYVDEREDNNKE